jgi:hypothetical protein
MSTGIDIDSKASDDAPEPFCPYCRQPRDWPHLVACPAAST